MLSMRILRSSLNIVKNYSNRGIENMSNLKYKIGDIVRIKDIDWYNENKDEYGNFDINDKFTFYADRSKYCGKLLTITEVFDDYYGVKEDNNEYYWIDEMIECLVERNGKTYPYKIGDRVILKGSNRCATITDLKYNSWGNLSYYIKIDSDTKDITIDYPTELLLPYDNIIECEVEEEEIEFTEEDKYWCDIMSESDPTTYVLPQGYQFVDENGNVINATKIVLEKKKTEYPKKFVDCCTILYPNYNFQDVSQRAKGHKGDLLFHFQKLLICRDAYWKLYGEEMGLDKPWEPDYDGTFEDGTPIKYVIYNNGTRIVKERKSSPNHILAFPT